MGQPWYAGSTFVFNAVIESFSNDLSVKIKSQGTGFFLPGRTHGWEGSASPDADAASYKQLSWLCGEAVGPPAPQEPHGSRVVSWLG